ncbi:MAG: CPBP family intramembrane metalloprotease [Deltaproteobacteria bacterium]|nr:CPBP family intramembrane metalloprotease [Deltaproteobacteria bacterium]
MNVPAVVAVAVATASFAITLSLRDSLDPWLTTAMAGAVAIALSSWALRTKLRMLFATTPRGLLAAIGLGIVLVAATHATYRCVAALSAAVADEVCTLYASTSTRSARGALAALTVLVVLAEELVWRGAAVAAVGDRGSRVRTGATITCLYAVPQALAGAWLLALVALGIGAIFATQRMITGRITDSFITHAIWSVAIFVVVPLV